MKSILLVALLFGKAVEGLAAERYVNVNNPSPAPPYLTWATAATTIQAAIDAASDGDVITVTNGVYQTGGSLLFQNIGTNRVSISKALLVQSVNGPGVTVINGGGAMRCAALVTNAVLSGFTLTNGSISGAYGGGVTGDPSAYPSRAAILTNCILSGNKSTQGAGGAHFCTLYDCVLTNNASAPSGGFAGGGAVYCDLNHCLITGNRGELGGGVWGGTLNDCMVTNNYASGYGGGARESVLNNCTLANNVAKSSGGGAYQCTMTNCLIIGNTVTNMSGFGGGVVALNGYPRPTLINCALVNNRASGSDSHGGGLYGAAWEGARNCAFTNNSASSGGGVYGNGDGTLYDCILVGNQATNGAGTGGGASFAQLVRCLVLGNSAKKGGGVGLGQTEKCVFGANSASIAGGGVYGAGMHRFAIITNNFAPDGGGFASDDTTSSSFDTCQFSGNVATNRGGAVYGGTDLDYCTIVGNSAGIDSGGVGGHDIYDNYPRVDYSIIYHNSAPFYPNYDTNSGVGSSCTTPMPANGGNNFTNDPAFVNLATANYRLSSISPCINYLYSLYPPNLEGMDLDGNSRLVGGGIDLGAYEFQTPTSLISYFWLQQYGFPTDGSADHADADGDQYDNWHEWVAHTSPLDATSLLKVLQVIPNGNSATVIWQSAPDLLYSVERSTNLTAFTDVSTFTTVSGSQGTNVTSFVDNDATGPGPFFYRVRVR